jgi:uncharacterized membrane protein
MLHAHGRSGTVDVTIALSMHLPGLAEQHVTAAARRPNPRERAVAVLRCCTETEDASQYLGEPDRACAGQPWAHPGQPDRSTGSEMVYNDVIEKIGMTIDAGGVVIIVAGAAIAFVASAVQLARRESDVYRRLRQRLGRAILLGLELLVAGDIVRTVAASPSLTGVAILAAIVLIRTFLSFSLEVETTGRWPWQKRDIAAP